MNECLPRCPIAPQIGICWRRRRDEGHRTRPFNRLGSIPPATPPLPGPSGLHLGVARVRIVYKLNNLPATTMNMSIIKQARKWTFAFGLLLSMQRGEAQFVNLTTEIQTVRWVYHGTNKPPTIQTKNWTMRCVVGTNSWLIEGDFFPAVHSWLFSGSNIVAHSVLSEYPSERKELFERNHPDLVIGRGHTEVFKSEGGAMPCGRALLAGTGFEDMAQNIPWLAFCSGEYLKRDHRRIPLPSNDFWSYGINYSDTTTVFEDGLGLPKAVDFYTDNGQPVCRYRVLESTNILGWNFPLRFELAQYRNEYGRGPWELNLTASGKVTSIGVGSQPQIPTENQKAIERNTASASSVAGQLTRD